LFTWGYNYNGILGDNTSISKSSPVQIGTSSWTNLGASNGTHMGAIFIDGRLYMWGSTGTGQLGQSGAGTGSYSSPMIVGTSSWTMVACAGNLTLNTNTNIAGTTYGILSDGTLYAWGDNSAFQYGATNTITRSSPTQIGTSSWSSVSSRNFGHASAVRLDKLLFAWGNNTSGQLGDGTTITKSSPTQIGTSSWNTVSAGTSYTIATNSNSILYGWGNNSSGQLGDGTTVNKSNPAQIFVNTTQSSPSQIGVSNWSAISAGQNNWIGGITS
jgi:alpha-tubulin suppressor-like RCC1 family protein